MDIKSVVKDTVTELDKTGYEVDKIKYVDGRPEKKLSKESLAGNKFEHAEVYTRYHVYHVNLVTSEKDEQDEQDEQGEQDEQTELNCTAQLRQLVEGENDDRRIQLSYGHATEEALKNLISAMLDHECKLRKENPKFSQYWANY